MTSRRQRLQPEQHNDTNLYSSHNVNEVFYISDSILINDHEIVEMQNYHELELGCYQPQSNDLQTSCHSSIARASTSYSLDCCDNYVANDHAFPNSSNHYLNFQPSSAMSSGQAEYQRKRKSMLCLFFQFLFVFFRTKLSLLYYFFTGATFFRIFSLLHRFW